MILHDYGAWRFDFSTKITYLIEILSILNLIIDYPRMILSGRWFMADLLYH